MTFTVPLPASHGCVARPLKVTDAAPVYPFESPMIATARLFAGSSDAEMAVLFTWPEVLTSVPVMSA